MKVLTARVLLLASLLAAIPLLREERAPALEPPLVARPSVARLGTVTVNPTNASRSVSEKCPGIERETGASHVRRPEDFARPRPRSLV